MLISNQVCGILVLVHRSCAQITFTIIVSVLYDKTINISTFMYIITLVQDILYVMGIGGSGILVVSFTHNVILLLLLLVFYFKKQP